MDTVRRLRARAIVLLAVFLSAFISLPARAQQQEVLSKEAYVLPPKEIADAVLSSRGEIVTLNNLSPDGRKFVVTRTDGLPPLERLARPYVHLGEMIFEHGAYRARSLWVQSAAGFDLFFYADGRSVPVQVPDRARVSSPVWSPDGSKLAFFAHFEDATHIYVADGDTGYSRRLTTTPVVATLDTSFQWSKDGKRIQTLLLPDDGKRELAKPSLVAAEPKVRVTRGGQNPSRNYRYLLESPYDMKLLEQLLTAQLAVINLDDGKVVKVGFPNMIRGVSMAPGEQEFRVTTIKKPFSYYVPLTRFGTFEGIWNLEGKSLYTLADRNLRDTEPQPGTAQPAGGRGAGGPAVAVAGGAGGGRGGRGGGRGGRGGAAGTFTAVNDPPTPTDPTVQPPTDPTQPPTDPTRTPTDPGQPPTGPQDPDLPGRGGFQADPDGRRDINWRPDGSSSLTFLQLEPAKGPNDPRNDQVVQWLPPFGKDDTKVIYSTPNRISSLQYSEDCLRIAFLTQTIDNQRQVSAIDLRDPKTIYVIFKGGAGFGGRGGGGTVGSPAAPPSTRPATRPNDGWTSSGGSDEDAGDVYSQRDERLLGGDGDGAAPATRPAAQPAPAAAGGRGARGGRGGGAGAGGRGGGGRGGAGAGGFGAGGAPILLTRPGPGQVSIVRISSGGDVYLTGSDRGATGAAGGAGAGANQLARPYIDKVNIKTGKKSRIFQAKGDMLESITAVDGDDVKRVFTTRQMKNVVPDSYVTDLDSGKATQLTHNVNKAPWFNELKVERFQVTRVDGFKFWVKVTTSPKSAGKLPAMFWIYPREYTDQASYDATAGRGEVTSNQFSAPAPRSITLLTLLDYAVVEPDVPIVGPAGRMNDNYVPDLRNSLWAVIDALDKRGMIDRDRLACGGHSYGGFSTANALAHTPFFKAGIAGDGNYNRTLTSMTFQTERRNLWDARDTYLEMSPLLWANQVNGALLLYHSMDDANVGTDPINAEHMFMALDGLGKPAALYMYPYEDHGPVARETILDQWARWAAWLDKYVKNAKRG